MTTLERLLKEREEVAAKIKILQIERKRINNAISRNRNYIKTGK